MPRFFIEDNYSNQPIIRGNDAHHIKQVLRMKRGDLLEILTADHKLLSCEIEQMADDSIVLKIVNIISENINPPRTVLAQGLVKGDKMDFIIQKSVELGVTDFVPLRLTRCVAEYTGDKAIKKCERWQKIAIEAAKQSKHCVLPTVHSIQSLNEFLTNCTAQLKLVAYELESTTTLKQVLRSSDLNVDTAFIVGAEGGLESREVQQSIDKGFVAISLGKQILRTETAPLALLAALQYEKS